MTPERYREMDSQGERTRREANLTLKKYGIRGQVTGLSSCFAVHFTGEPIRNYRETAAAKDDVLIPSLLNLSLLNRGFYLSRKASAFLSIAISEEEVGAFLKAFDESLQEIRPVIEEETPELIIE
jgi:glutamate-1-semialdehyde aminotransferase